MPASFLFLVSILFFCLILFLFAFWVERKNKSYSNAIASLSLIIASILGGIFAWEFFLALEPSLLQKQTRHPPAPDIFKRLDTQPHVRVQDSILYLASTNQPYRTFGLSYKTNGLGFREHGFRFKKDEGVFRILVFGDSVTFGVGVATEIRYSNLLERMLNLNFDAQDKRKYKKVEVLNFGVPGYTLDQTHDLIKGILQVVQSDLIVVGIIDDDLKMTTRYSLKGFTLNAGKDAVPIKLYKNTERTFATIPEREPPSFARTPAFWEQTHLYKLLTNRTGWFSKHALPTKESWEYALKEFLGIKTLTEHHRLPPPVIGLLHYGSVDPNQNDFIHPKGKLAENIEILNFIGEQLSPQGFIMVNTLARFQEHNKMSIAVSEWEWHPNLAAHYIYAKAIMDELLHRNLIP